MIFTFYTLGTGYIDDSLVLHHSAPTDQELIRLVRCKKREFVVSISSDSSGTIWPADCSRSRLSLIAAVTR